MAPPEDAAGIELAHYLREGRGKVDRALDRAGSWLAEGLGNLVADKINSASAYAVSGGGKRIRPLLCAAAYRACGGQASDDALFDFAASIELVHASSLMHDDLPCMDDAELRRGTPVPHLVYGERATMLAGAILIPAAVLLAFESSAALECGTDGGRKAAIALARASGAPGMVGGQWLDLMAENRVLSIEELDDLHRRKTGALLAVSPEMGARAAAASAERIEALHRYGASLGLAFQIVDDILDATGDAATLGKEPSDAELGKSTYVSHWGVEAARARAREEAERALAALDGAGLDTPVLSALAELVVSRRR